MDQTLNAERAPRRCTPRRRILASAVEDPVNGLDGQPWRGGPHTASSPRGRVRISPQYDGVTRASAITPDVVAEKSLNKDEENFRFSTWNIGTMNGKEDDLPEVLKKRGIHLCCVGEVKKRGEGSKMIKGYRFYWKGQPEKKGGKGKKEKTVAEAGVGILLTAELSERVLGVASISERLMILKLEIGGRILHVISAYAPQAGRDVTDKDKFWNKLHEEVRKIPKEDFIWFGSDLNGHIGEETAGYVGVHGGVGYGDMNEEGRRILDFSDTHGLTIGNTWFTREEKRLITYSSGFGENKKQSVIDYVIVRAEDRKYITNVKVIAGEEIVKQHRLVVCDMKLKVEKKKKVKWVSKIKVWKLKEEKARQEYVQKLRAVDMDTCHTVNERWTCMKEAMVKASEQVCGKTKGPPRHKETWWWSEEVSKIVEEKQKCYQKWFKAREEDSDEQEELKETYKEAKKKAKKAVTEAKQAKRKEFAEQVNTAGGKQKVFKIAKQMVRKNKVTIGGNCLKDENGKLVTGEENLKKEWKNYMEKLLNEENEWDGNVEVDKIEGPLQEISYEEVEKALKKMQCGKAAGPSGVMADQLKGGEEVVIEQLRDLCNQILIEEKIPDDWRRSTMTTLYKGKGDPLSCGAYRGIKLLEHGLKVFDRILDCRIRNIVNIDKSQFGFMPGRGTVDAVFVVRQLQEKYLGKMKKLYLGFVDLEKAFDRVPREVVKWALRKEGVDEWLVKAVMYTYFEAKTAVRVGSGLTEDFEVKVGVHQGAVLSPLLFIIVMQAVTKHVSTGLPWELLYADDLVVMAETEEELRVKLISWKGEMEKKGLRVNIGKTKVMCSELGKGRVNKSANYPCGVCGLGVRQNSIWCIKCEQWIHYKCTKLKSKKKKLASLSEEEKENYTCKKCEFEQVAGSGFESGKEMTLNGSDKCEVVDKFCYLGDMLSVGGGVDAAVVTRIGSGWKKFRELEPILTAKDVSDDIKSQLYTACVRTVMIYGAETWPMTKVISTLLDRAEMRMVRWMCNKTLMDKISSDELRNRLKIPDIGEMLRRARLRWFGHVMRKDDDDWVKRCMNLTVEGTAPRGQKKTWRKTVNEDMKLK